MGYLPEAMVNYLALLGWGDGTENEFFTLEQLGWWFSLWFYYCILFLPFQSLFLLFLKFVSELLFGHVLGLTVEKFSISRVNKSGAVFDSTKLR